MHFLLYSRVYCHLCDDLRDALLAMQDELGPITVEMIDVDADPALLARFDELVPVLFGANSAEELCHYHLNPAAVRAYARTQSVSK